MSRPFIDLHVLRDDTVELALYGDDGERIPEPTPEQLAWAIRRLHRVLATLAVQP